MCLCTVYWSHRVHLSKNQKHDLSLSSKLAKTEEKKVVVFCCALKAEVFPLSSPLGLKACSLEGIGAFGPVIWRSSQNHFNTSGFGVRPKQCISRIKDSPSLIPSLKPLGTVPLPESSDSTKQSLLPVVCVCSWHLHLLHTGLELRNLC